MSVDLSDLIPSILREVQPPGTDSYPNASDDDWLGQLEDAFWEAKLFGFFDNYSEADGLVSPIAPTTEELGRDWQQLLVLFAGIRATRMKLINTNTSLRAKAGPVEFETQTSANTLTLALKQLQDKVNILLANLEDSIIGSSATYYINGLTDRSLSLTYGTEIWSG